MFYPRPLSRQSNRVFSYFPCPSHQKQPDKNAHLGNSIDPLLQPVCPWIAGIQPKGKIVISTMPRTPNPKKTQAGKSVSPAKIAAPLRFPRSTISAASITRNPTGIRIRICILLRYCSNQLPQHLHDTGNQADSRTDHKQRAGKQAPNANGRKPEAHHRNQVHQRQRDAEPRRDRTLRDFIVAFFPMGSSLASGYVCNYITIIPDWNVNTTQRAASSARRRIQVSTQPRLLLQAISFLAQNLHESDQQAKGVYHCAANVSKFVFSDHHRECNLSKPNVLCAYERCRDYGRLLYWTQCHRVL